MSGTCALDGRTTHYMTRITRKILIHRVKLFLTCSKMWWFQFHRCSQALKLCYGRLGRGGGKPLHFFFNIEHLSLGMKSPRGKEGCHFDSPCALNRQAERELEFSLSCHPPTPHHTHTHTRVYRPIIHIPVVYLLDFKLWVTPSVLKTKYRNLRTLLS